MNHPEFNIQAAFVKFVRQAYPHLLYTCSPIRNATKMQKIRAYQMGYAKGTPDWLCFEPRGQYHGLLIEFKAPSGDITNAQEDFLLDAEKRGYATLVCNDQHKAVTYLGWYLAL